eukprot:TRINITY_DN4904_c0_g2_i1.p1 TRINITY_DN4904_c0_g2~~TRINITY_DN4904_c0_g2_i1.p1  ORF type:complete len:1227 (+),score=159.88 TRINITY_DN4904_c0_g2_i1:225-3905(+)
MYFLPGETGQQMTTASGTGSTLGLQHSPAMNPYSSVHSTTEGLPVSIEERLQAIAPPSSFCESLVSETPPFQVDSRQLRFNDPTFETEFVKTRTPWMRKLGVYLCPAVGVFHLVYIILNHFNTYYPAWFLYVRLAALALVLVHFALTVYKRSTENVLQVSAIILAIVHLVMGLIGVATRHEQQFQQELGLSLVLIATFVLRIGLFRHVIGVGGALVLSYTLLWAIMGGPLGSPCRNGGCFIQLDFCAYFAGLYVVLAWHCYKMERTERDAFALKNKILEMTYLIATMDLDACDALKLRAPDETQGEDNEPNTEQYLWTIVENLRDFRAYLPQALLKKDKRGRSLSQGSQRSRHTDVYGNVVSSFESLSDVGGEDSLHFRGAKNYAVLGRAFGMRDATVLVVRLPYLVPLPSSAQQSGLVGADFLKKLYHMDEIFNNVVLSRIEETGGIVMSFGGGVVVGTWNAHHVSHQHSYWACWCAVTLASAIAQEISELSGEEKSVLSAITVEMAVVSGPCVVGSSGTATMRSPVVLGGAVQLAYQLVELNSVLGTNILISQDVYEAVESMVVADLIDSIHPTAYPAGARLAVYELRTITNSHNRVPPKDHTDALLLKEAFIDFSHHRFTVAEEKLVQYLSDANTANRQPSVLDTPAPLLGGGGVAALAATAALQHRGTPAQPVLRPVMYNVKQALRLLRLARHFAAVVLQHQQTDSEQSHPLPLPYHRVFGWDPYEMQAQNVAVPPQFAQLAAAAEPAGSAFVSACDSGLGLSRRPTTKIREHLNAITDTGESRKRPKSAQQTETSTSSSLGDPPTLPKKVDYHAYLMRTDSSELNLSPEAPNRTAEEILPSPLKSLASPKHSVKSSLTQGEYNPVRSIQLLQKSIVRDTSAKSAALLTPAAESSGVENPKQPAMVALLPLPAQPLSPSVATHLSVESSSDGAEVSYVVSNVMSHTGSSMSSLDIREKAFVDCDGKTWYLSDVVLGQGGYGRVRLGMSESGMLVAIKQVAVQSQSPTLREEMLNEIRLLSTFRHDNIVAYLGSAVLGRNLMIVMEYVPCGSLCFILRHFGKLAPRSVAHYTRHIVRGLAYLHSRNIVHRDIKPGNLLLDASGRCKLTDFGTSDYFTEIRPNDVRGTPMYVAPEALAKNVSKASDIWSLGLTVLELLTGRLPWETGNNNNPHYLLNLIASPDKLPTIPPELPAHAKTFILSCLERDTEQRPTTQKLLDHPFLL